MASDRPNQTAVDYVTIVLSPVLVMGLVGSLVFFLLEVAYKTDGQWKERLQWILFFFVFGMVLVARISMHGEISARARFYGPVLAFVAYLGMQSFIEYPPGVKELSFLVNLLIVILVWWCTYRLTWDCTNVDEETDMSGEGLLQASGLEDKPEKKPHPQDDEEPMLLEEETKKGPLAWWERYKKYREQRNKKRTLGVWVVYFSLAALPIFGLGQSLIPLTAPGRRQFSFWLMTIYVGCGLGLLLTTCFLGLRRYLRQKRLQMPAAMTGAWLTMGATLLVVLLLVGALLPRPAAEYSTIRDVFDPAGSAKRTANRFAAKGDSPAEGEGQPGQAGKDGKTQGNQTGEKGEGKGNDKDGKASGDKDGKNGRDKGDNKGQKGNEKAESKDRSNQRDAKQGEKSDASKDAAKGNKEAEKGKQSGSSSSSTSSTNAVQQMLQKVAPVLKWIVFGVLALVVLAALLRGGLGFLANFTDWAKNLLAAWRNFWANLFGKPKSEEEEEGEESEVEQQAQRALPFSAFSNPFDSGKASRMSPRELIRYTFRAVEAWARERDLGREDGETAMEFLGRLGDEVPSLDAEAQRLGQLHARAEYGRGGLPESVPDQLKVFWEKLERVSGASLSA